MVLPLLPQPAGLLRMGRYFRVQRGWSPLKSEVGTECLYPPIFHRYHCSAQHFPWFTAVLTKNDPPNQQCAAISAIAPNSCSRTISEISQLLVHISDTLCFWATFCGLRDNIQCSSWAHWKAHSGLPISIYWTFALGVTGESLRVKRDRKSVISLHHGQFDPKFQVEGVAPTNHFCTVS